MSRRCEIEAGLTDGWGFKGVLKDWLRGWGFNVFLDLVERDLDLAGTLEVGTWGSWSVFKHLRDLNDLRSAVVISWLCRLPLLDRFTREERPVFFMSWVRMAAIEGFFWVRSGDVLTEGADDED